jgi:hypothetical protein
VGICAPQRVVSNLAHPGKPATVSAVGGPVIASANHIKSISKPRHVAISCLRRSRLVFPIRRRLSATSLCRLDRPSSRLCVELPWLALCSRQRHPSGDNTVATKLDAMAKSRSQRSASDMKPIFRPARNFLDGCERVPAKPPRSHRGPATSGCGRAFLAKRSGAPMAGG